MPSHQIPLEPGYYYHIWTHANGQENLFKESKNYGFFLQKYQKYISPIACTYAYCLMPNHLHLLISVKQKGDLNLHFRDTVRIPIGNELESSKVSRILSQQFSNCFNSYTKSYNKYYNRKGSLFISNFKRKKVVNEEYLAGLVTYIHNNPIYHKFSHSARVWPFSSYKYYTSNLEKPAFLFTEKCLKWFGNDVEFSKAHNEALIEKMGSNLK